MKSNKIYGYLNLIKDIEERKQKVARYIACLENKEIPTFAQGARKVALEKVEGNFALIGKVLQEVIDRHQRYFITEPDKIRLKNI